MKTMDTKPLAQDEQNTRRAKKLGFTRLAQVGIPLILIIAVSFALAPAAHASTSCTYPLCSETYNQSPYFVVVAHDWCGNSETLYQNNPPCGAGAQTEYLYTNQHTDSHQDWDAMRVDIGWKYIVQVYSVIFGWSSVGSFDNRNGTTAMWVRVHNDQTMYVQNQIYRS